MVERYVAILREELVPSAGGRENPWRDKEHSLGPHRFDKLLRDKRNCDCCPVQVLRVTIPSPMHLCCSQFPWNAAASPRASTNSHVVPQCSVALPSVGSALTSLAGSTSWTSGSSESVNSIGRKSQSIEAGPGDGKSDISVELSRLSVIYFFDMLTKF